MLKVKYCFIFLDQQVDERQLINQVQAVGDGYELRAYGKTLKFNSDGDLV